MLASYIPFTLYLVSLSGKGLCIIDATGQKVLISLIMENMNGILRGASPQFAAITIHAAKKNFKIRMESIMVPLSKHTVEVDMRPKKKMVAFTIGTTQT